MAEASPSSLSSPRTLRGRLAQPSAVLIVLPLLVALAGAVTGWIGYRSAVASARAMAQITVVEAAGQVRDLCVVLAQEATHLSQHLATLASGHADVRSGDVWAPHLADCFAARPALTWLSISYPDGTFIGLTNENSQLTFTIQDQEDGGRRRDWTWRDHALTPAGTRTHYGYDPRVRPFYRLATAQRGPVWTEAYRFFGSGLTGVSLARPVYTAEGDLLAVVTVDYTTLTISAAMERLAGGLCDRLLIHDATGTVVASAGLDATAPSPSADRLLTLADLTDPLAAAYASVPGTTGLHRTPDGRMVQVASEAVAATDLPWQVAVISELGPRLAPARRNLIRSALLTLLVVLGACGLGALYARYLVRMRGMVRQARAVAAEAQAEAASFGSYVLEKKLGAGGMGEVWRARHRLLARPAALKLIRREAEDADEHAVVRFEREARITASLNSPHTVTVYDYGILDDGTCYYVMELLDGEDLDGFLKRNRRLPQEAVVHILLQACDSLHEAHEAGLVHRDLKPANIFMAHRGCRADIVKVLDFGLVALAGKRKAQESAARLTMAGFVQGTPGFMAPEQLRDEALDRRADLYALGCVAFWLLTGRAVFPADNLMDELRRHLEEDPTAPSAHTDQPVAPALDSVILACLARNPDQRPASAQALRDRLLACGVVPAFPAALWGARSKATSPAAPTTSADAAVQLRVKGRRRRGTSRG